MSRAVVDLSEGTLGAVVEPGVADRPIRRVTGEDCYIPLGDVA